MARDIRIEAENRPGQLAAIGETLGAAGVNIEGFSATVGEGTGYLHVLVADDASARSALEGAGYKVTAERDAVSVIITEDRPGYLGELGRKLADAGVNVEASYVATGNRVVFVTADAGAAQAALG